MDSKIINSEALKTELIKLCEFDPAPVMWHLLYRGSQYNFDWTKFHAMCDNKSPTLVIIKSKDEEIFGGYTEALWNDPDVSKKRSTSNSSDYFNGRYKFPSKFKADPNAFLFILNQINYGSVMQTKANVSDKNFAIYCNKSDGPCFGKYDLVIETFCLQADKKKC